MKPEQIEKIYQDWVDKCNDKQDGNLKELIQAGWDAHIQSLAEITDEGMLDVVASLKHEQWWFWASALEQAEELSTLRKTHWHRLYIPYDQLEEKDKESDRVWAKKVLSKVLSSLRAKVEKQENPYKGVQGIPEYYDIYERCCQDTLKLLGGK